MRLILTAVISMFGANAYGSSVAQCADFASSGGCIFGNVEYSPAGMAIDIKCWVPPNPPNPGYYHVAAVCSVFYGDNVPKTPNGPSVPREPNQVCGSIVNTSDQVIGETVRVVGTGGSLSYRSNRTLARLADYKFTHLLNGSTPEPYATTMTVDVRIAGQVHTTNYPTVAANVSHSFTWDGKDNLGNWVNHGEPVEIEVNYTYSNPSITSVPFFHRQLTLGGYRAALMGLGEWTFSSVHFLDTKLNLIHYGTGETRDVSASKINLTSGQIEIVATGSFDYYMVTDVRDEKAYLFDASGRHAQTRSTRTGALLETISYDVAGRLASITDAYSKTISFNRPNATTVEIISPYGQTTALTLDGNDRLINVEDPMGNDHQITYDSAGLMATFQNPRGATNTFTYDSLGLLVQDSHSAGAAWTLTNTATDNGNGSVTRYGDFTSQMGRQVSQYISITPAMKDHYEAYPNGKVVSSTSNQTYSNRSESPGYTRTIYKGSDPRFSTQEPYINSETVSTGGLSLNKTRSKAATFSTTDVLNPSDLTETTTINSQNWVNFYDGATKIETSTSPLGRVQMAKFDSLGKLIEYKPYSYGKFDYVYDPSGRISEVTQSARTTAISYNGAGFVSQIENPLSQVTSYTFDANGQILTQTLPDLRVLNYTYDANGNLTSVTTAASILHDLTYNMYDQMASYVAPPMASVNYVTTYGFNNDRQMTSITRPDSSVVTLNYGSSTGLLTSIVAPEGTYSNSYNAGRLTQSVSPDSVYLNISYYGYMGARIENYKTSWGSVFGEVTYTYSSLLPDSLTIKDANANSSSASLIYDEELMLAQAGDLTNTRSSTTGQITGTTLNNSTEVFAYDSTYGELEFYRHRYSGADTYKEEHARDLLGRITTRDVTVGGVTTNYSYIYDSAGRLKEVWTNSALTRTYNYSANSNRTSVVQGATTTSATYDAQDRLLTYGNYSFSYNARGELSGRTKASSVEAFTYTYNSMGALRQVTHAWDNSGTTVTDTYDYLNDALGRRVEVQKNTVVQKRFIYDEHNRLVAELDSAGDMLSHFVYANKAHVPDYMIKSGVKYKFVHDHVGSVVQVVNSSTGALASSITYDEFGKITSSTSLGFQPFGFAGGIRDDVTGFIRFGARDYDPETGRWTSKDPIWFGGGDTNLYGYVLADPINFVDPTGNIRDEVFEDALNNYIDAKNLQRESEEDKKCRFAEENRQYDYDQHGRTPINPMLPPNLFPLPGPRPPHTPPPLTPTQPLPPWLEWLRSM